MNGRWYPWGVGNRGTTAAEYVAMWRHVHNVFASVGASNVTWVWCPNVNASDTFKRLSALYPGNAYVGWTCIDGYNGDIRGSASASCTGRRMTRSRRSLRPSR